MIRSTSLISAAVMTFGVVLAVAALAGCGGGDAEAKAAPDRRVMVSVPPLVGLIKPLVADDVEVVSVVPANVSVHGFTPDPETVAATARSAMVVLVGFGMEDGWARRSSSAPLGRVVRLEDFIDPEDCGDPTHDHDHGDHDDGDHAGHHHGPIDPHVWLDPGLVSGWLAGVYETIPVDLRREGDPLAAQLAAIAAIDEAYRETLEPFQGAAIVTHHNAFGRIASRYGLTIAEALRPVETAEPSPDQVAKTRRAIEAEGARAMFVEPQFDQSLARRLADEAGIPVGVLDPLGADWEAMMRSNLETLATILTPTGATPVDHAHQP